MCQAVLSSLEPHLGLQSLYGHKSFNNRIELVDSEELNTRRPPPEPTPKPGRGVHITWDSDVTDSTDHSEVTLRSGRDHLRPR